MKTWMKATAVVALMGIAGFAQGKDKTAAADKPLTGKITSITPEKDKPETLDIVVTSGGKKNPHDVTVTADASMKVTINGEDKKASDLVVGEVVIVKPATGAPTSIEAKTGHKKKADPAAAPAAAPAAK